MLIHTEHSITVNQNLDKVFGVTNDVQKWPELLPPCRDLTILKTEHTRFGPKVTINVTFFTGGRMMTWQSERLVDFKNKRARSRRLEPLGPFKSMEMEWVYEKLVDGTKLTFIHDFEMKWGLLGYLIGRFYVVPVHIARDAKIELQAIKARLEADNEFRRVARGGYESAH